MTAHDHRTYVDGCFRCELSADEVTTPNDIAFDAAWRKMADMPSSNPSDYVHTIFNALAAAGYQVVTDNLVDACRQLTVPLTKQTLQARAEALQRIRACIAILDGADPMDVFTEGGA